MKKHAVTARNGDTIIIYEHPDGFACPICGHLQPDPAPYDPVSGAPSDEWCSCCEFQFGWDDLVSPYALPGEQAEKWRELREKWLAGGVPADFAAQQLQNIEIDLNRRISQ